MTEQRSAWLALALPGALSVLAAGCEADFPAYNELEGFRVLALRASPPAFREGESTTLDALVFVRDGELADVTYAWSWCPLREPIWEGGDCALDAAQFAELLGVPESSIQYELGSAPTAELAYPGTAAAYRTACQNQAQSNSVQAAVFSCAGGFPVSVRADVSYGGETIRIQKEVRFVFDDESPNQNPSLGDLTFKQSKAKETTPWTADAEPAITLGKEYELHVDVSEEHIESFVPEPNAVDPNPSAQKETLFVTWFVESGTTDFQRTTFIADELEIEDLEVNHWKLPKSGDESRRKAHLYLVLRDERGGVDWLERTAELRP